MKLNDPKSGRSGGFASLAILILPWTANAAVTKIYKENNTDDLKLGSSWEFGVAPGATDIAAWDGHVTDSNESLLGANLSWSGILVEQPWGDVTISGSHTLTLGGDGINLDQTGPNLSINTPVILGAAQTWTAASSRNINVSGSISGGGSLTKMGFGNLRLSGTTSNTFTSPLVIDTTGLTNVSSTFLDKSSGALAIPANGAVNFGIGGTGEANLRMLQSNQFGAGAVIRYGNANGQWARFDLMGTNQTLAGLHGGSVATRAGAIVQNREINNTTATRGTSVLTLNGNTTDPNYPIGSHTYNGVTRDGYVFNGYMRDADSGANADNRLALVKEGNGLQVLGGDQIRLSGGVTINGGAIELLSGNVWDNASGMTTVNAGGRLSSVAAVNLNGGLTLNGGELGGLGAPITNYGHWVLGSNATVGGTSTSKITCDLRIGGDADRTITVNSTGDPSGIDLDFAGSGRLGHTNNVKWGYMTKAGPGTLRFNNNGDIGRITVNGGKVVFNECFTGMGNGGLINNAQVDIINSADITFAQPVYGTGSLTKSGAGKLTLSNGNTAYTGATTVAGGSLQLGAGGAIAVASSSITTSGDLIFNHSNLQSYGGNISGTGNLIKAGTGTLVLTGNLSYTGSTSVTGGILSIPGSFSKPVSVSGGGSFLGGQSVSSLSLNGGNFQSTGSPLAVAGDLVLSGSNPVTLLAPPALGSGDILLMTYGGTLTGGAANLTFPQAAIYRGTPAFTTDGGQVKLTGLVFRSQTWTGATNGNWDILTTANWNNGSGSDTFATGDAVVFGDSATTKTVVLPTSTLISPSLVTFNNSTGNDYSITGNAAGRGFTGGTSIVKNGTGTATLEGYGHNYTGTVTINGGVLKPNGNYEMLGNASGVFVNAGGQLNINGMNLGNGTRSYSLTIAGQGPDSKGAVTNSNTTGPSTNAGFLNLALSADASVGGDGGRFDFGRSGNYVGNISGNGHTLTKVGSSSVVMHGAATDIRYVVSGGTLGFEDSDAVTGPHPIIVNAGTLQAWGLRRFSNPLQLAGGTTLDSNGNGTQTWSGNIAITSAGNVTLAARAGGLNLEGAISGNADVTKTGTNAVQFLGATSNSFTGKLKINSNGAASGSSHLFFGKTGGAVAVPAGVTVELGTGTTGETNLRMLEDNQFGAGVRMDYKNAASSWGRFDLMGTDQSLAGVNSGTATTLGGGIVQNRELGGSANRGTSVLTLTGNLTDTNYPVGDYLFNGYARDADSGVSATNKLEIVKNGTGTQAFAGTNITYSGNLTVNNGKVSGLTAWPKGTSIATSLGARDNARTITVNTGGVLEFAAANMFGGHNATSVPTLVINGGTVTNADPANTKAVNNGIWNVVLNNGTLTSTTGNSESTIDATRPGEIYGAWGLNGSVTSSGNSVISTTSAAGTVLLGSTGQSTVFDVTGGSLTVSAPLQDGDASTLARLVKNGPGQLVLTGANTYSTETVINDGSVVLAESGKLRFKVTDYSSTCLSGVGAVDLRGTFNIDTANVRGLNGSWLLVDTDTLNETYAASFTLGAGWTKAGGVWTRKQGSKTWTFTQATGELTLSTPANSFEAWAYDKGLSGNDALPEADPDGDGIVNSTEMVLGGNPTGGLDLALLPSLQLVTNPAGMPAGNYLQFTYRRTDASVAAALVSACQYDGDLAGAWTTAADGVNGVKVLIDDNYGAFNPPVTEPTDRVRVMIPRGANPKLFGRLSVIAP